MKTPMICLTLLLCAMRPDHGPAQRGSGQPAQNQQSMQKKINLQVGDHYFPVTLREGPAAEKFFKMLPVRIAMQDLNGNEKYGDLNNGLPAKATVPNGIEAGDIMLFGKNTLVIFYRSFSTTYGYTPIGKVDDPRRLEAALGEGDVEVNLSE